MTTFKFFPEKTAALLLW